MKTASSIIILACWALIGYLAIHSAPDVITPEFIDLSLSQDIAPSQEGVIIGYKELGQRKGPRSAERYHLLIRHTKKGWDMANIARMRKVDVRTNQRGTVFLKRWRLQQGDVIRIVRQQIPVRVAKVSPELELTHDTRKVEWKKEKLTPHNEFVYLQCRSLWWRLKNRIRWRFEPKRDREVELFRLGGSVNGPDQWKIPGVAPNAARILRLKDSFWLAPGKPDIPVTMERNGEKVSFNQLLMPFKKDHEIVNRLILGRTYYDVKILSDPDKLRLKPLSGQDVWTKEKPYPLPNNEFVVFDKPEKSKPKQKNENRKWIGSGYSALDWIIQYYYVLIAALVFAMLIGYVAFRLLRYGGNLARFDISGKITVIALLPACFFIPIMLLFAQKLVFTDIAMLFILSWAAWAWATLYIVLKYPSMDKVGWIWPAALFLAASGCIIMTQLATGALNTRWLIYTRKHLLLMAALGWLMIPFFALSEKYLKTLWIQSTMETTLFWKSLRIVSFLGLITFLFLQLAKGGELGTMGIQPTEAAKFGLVVLAGFVGMHLTILRGLYSEAYQQSPAAYVFNFLLVMILLDLAVIFVLVGLHDISPILIMMIFLFTWVWNIAPHPWERMIAGRKNSDRCQLPLDMRRAKYIIRGGLIMELSLLLITGWRFYTNAGKLPDWVPQKDRIQVWANPERHPHSGDQVLKAMRLAGYGGWLGAGESRFGLNGQIMHLPVV